MEASANTRRMQQELDELRRRHRDRPNDRWIERKIRNLETHLGAYQQPISGGKVDTSVPELDTLSPEGVQNAKGFTKIELPDISPPEWARDGDPEDGLRISNRRSFGCHMLQSLQETGELWTQKPEQVSKFYGGSHSPRVYLYAGRKMLDRWFMLPTAQLREDLPHYTFAPPILPYTNAEYDYWKEAYVKFHFNAHAILMGGYKNRSHLDYHPMVVAGKPVYKHQMVTVTNHPEYIMPALNSEYETANFKMAYFETSVGQLMNMDIGVMAKNEFYEDWKPYAEKEGLPLREYHHRFEPTMRSSYPKFQKGLEIV